MRMNTLLFLSLSLSPFDLSFAASNVHKLNVNAKQITGAAFVQCDKRLQYKTIEKFKQDSI